jgi:hypothetical protein
MQPQRVRFDARLTSVHRRTIVRLPASASERLPSRGQVAVQGTVNGHEFETVLEPDGKAGQWLRIEPSLRRAAGLGEGERATLEIEPTKKWPEPAVPADLRAALAAASQKIRYIWQDITPMARWEWVRWVNATKIPETRKRRVEVTISKMSHGKRRPCCFDLSSCTDPDLSKDGKLLELA